jgi:hypothetical protein
VPLQSPAQVVGDAVYYIDGFGTVRELRATGQPQLVASFSVQPVQYETWFAVSRQGSSVLAGILQYPAIGSAPPNCVGLECMPPLVGPWRFSLAMAEAQKPAVELQHWDSSTHPDMQNGGWHPEFPVAWTADGPIIMLPMSVGTQNAWWGGSLYLVDSSGAKVRQIGGSDCMAASITAGRFVACTSGQYLVSVRDLSGNVLWTPRIDGFNALVLGLSPNGMGALNERQVETKALGMANISPTFYVEGWIDNNTIIGRPVIGNGPDKGNLSWISLSDPGTVHDLGLKADFVGTLG